MHAAEEAAALAVIQAGMKGRQTRNRLSRRQDASVQIQSVVMGYHDRMAITDWRFDHESEAARVIQGAIHGRGHRAIGELGMEEYNALVTLQGALRGKEARSLSELSVVLNLDANVLQAALKGMLMRLFVAKLRREVPVVACLEPYSHGTRTNPGSHPRWSTPP